MKMPIIVLFANSYAIADEKTGEINSGVSVSYYFNTEFSATDNSDGSRGMRPAKSSCDVSVMKKIQKAPALYDAEFEMKIGSDMKPVLKILDLDLLEEVRIVPLSKIKDDDVPAADVKK